MVEDIGYSGCEIEVIKCSVRAAPSGTKAGLGSTAVTRSSVGQRVKIGGNAILALLWVYKSLGPDASGCVRRGRMTVPKKLIRGSRENAIGGATREHAKIRK